MANFCTDKTIALAREFGAGVVTAKNSNDYGIGQYYTKRFAENEMVVIEFYIFCTFHLKIKFKHLIFILPYLTC